MKLGVLGSGSWATAIAKILTDNGNQIHWWFRDVENRQHLQSKGINPRYLSKTIFDTDQLILSANVNDVIDSCDIIVIVVPSVYVEAAFESVDVTALVNKKIVSAVKGIIPSRNEMVSDFLMRKFNISMTNYFTLLGPCHAEEVAAEKLSYLTFSGQNGQETQAIASCFQNNYINVRVNTNLQGVQYAAVLKNIYALGAGIASGLEYGDNFRSVLIANCAGEMERFLHKITTNKEVFEFDVSVFLGDLLVTCYSLYSRNRMFGTMIGKGYSVRAAKLELNMEAEGYNASKCIHEMNKIAQCEMPIAEAVYTILWKSAPALQTFHDLEQHLI